MTTDAPNRIAHIPRTTWIVIGVASVIVMASFALTRSPFLAPEDNEKLASSTVIQREIGTVEIKQKDEPWLVVENESRIQGSTIIKTANDSRATLLLPGNNVLRLHENTQLHLERIDVDKKTNNVVVTAREINGELWLKASSVFTPGATIGIETFNARVLTNDAKVQIHVDQNNTTDIKLADGHITVNTIKRSDTAVTTTNTIEIDTPKHAVITNEMVNENTDISINDMPENFRDHEWVQWNIVKDRIIEDMLSQNARTATDPYVLDTNKQSVTTYDVLSNEKNYENVYERKLEAYLLTGAPYREELKITNKEELNRLLATITETRDKAIEQNKSEKEFWMRTMVVLTTLKSKEKLDHDLIKRIIEEVTVNTDQIQG
jgi:hypothetical protein